MIHSVAIQLSQCIQLDASVIIRQHLSLKKRITVMYGFFTRFCRKGLQMTMNFTHGHHRTSKQLDFHNVRKNIHVGYTVLLSDSR